MKLRFAFIPSLLLAALLSGGSAWADNVGSDDSLTKTFDTSKPSRDSGRRSSASKVRSSSRSPFVSPTHYKAGEVHKPASRAKAERNESARTPSARQQGFSKVPSDRQRDRVIPLSKVGSNLPPEMQLLAGREHQLKTTRARGRADRRGSELLFGASK